MTNIEKAAELLEVHQLQWISHEDGWDCGCNERGELPPMLFLRDALRHQAEALSGLLIPDDAEVTTEYCVRTRGGTVAGPYVEARETWEAGKRELWGMPIVQRTVTTIRTEWQEVADDAR